MLTKKLIFPSLQSTLNINIFIFPLPPHYLSSLPYPSPPSLTPLLPPLPLSSLPYPSPPSLPYPLLPPLLTLSSLPPFPSPPSLPYPLLPPSLPSPPSPPYPLLPPFLTLSSLPSLPSPPYPLTSPPIHHSNHIYRPHPYN